MTRGGAAARLEDQREAGTGEVVEAGDALAERPGVGALGAGLGLASEDAATRSTAWPTRTSLPSANSNSGTDTARSGSPAGARR